MLKYINENGYAFALLVGELIITIFVIIWMVNFDDIKERPCVEQRSEHSVEDYEIFNPLGGNWNLFTRPKE